MESEPLEVINWSPMASILTDTSNISIEISFSADPNKTSIEEAFSLTSDGIEIPGIYYWNNSNTLQYNLFHDLSPGHNFILKVSTQAEDSLGNSLREDFSHRFSTKKTTSRPILLSYEPYNFSAIDNPYQEIILNFDKSMSPESIVDQFAISPSVTGYFTWSVNQKIFTFNPSEPYSWQKDYIVTLSENTQDSDGWTLGYEHQSHFHHGLDQTPPNIIRVTDELETNFIVRDNPDHPVISITQGWEKNWNILIQFSEAMNRQSVESALTIEPQCHWAYQWSSNSQGDQLLLEWEESLEYGKTYSLRISDSVKDFYDNNFRESQTYHFQVNGASSKPPELKRLVYISDALPYREEILYDKDNPVENNVEYLFSNIDEASEGGPIIVFFDFYFDIADSAYISQFSFMENFTILPQNGALTFTPLNIIAQIDATIPDYGGSTPPNLLDDFLVVRIKGEMADSDTAIGMVEFKVYKDFGDTLENKMTEDWYWQIFDLDT